MPDLSLGKSHRSLAALVAALTLLAACGSEDGAPTPPSAEAFRDRTVAALRQLSTVHFEVAHETGGTDLGGGLVLLTAEGDDGSTRASIPPGSPVGRGCSDFWGGGGLREACRCRMTQIEA